MERTAFELDDALAVAPVTDTTSINLRVSTSTTVVNAAVAVNFGATVLTSASNTETAPYVGVLTSFPSGGFTAVLASGSAVANGALVAVSATGTILIGTSRAASGSTLTYTGLTASTVTATTTSGAGSFSFTPTVAGEYVLTVWNDVANPGIIDLTEGRQTVNITVAAASGFSTNLSTAFVGVSTLTAAEAQALAIDDEIRVSSAASTDAAIIGVVLKNTSGTAYSGGGTLDVQVMSGPGFIDVLSAGSAYADASARADTLILPPGTSAANVAVTGDGTAGTSQIRIRLLDSTTGASLGTIATKTVYFFGTVASLTVTQVLKYAKPSTTAIGCSSATTCSGLTAATTAFNTIVAKDADGNLVPALSITAVSSDATVLATSTVLASTVKLNTVAGAGTCATGATDCLGLGFYTANMAGAATAVSGKTATITYRTLLSGTTFVTATPITVTIGGAIATETVSFDKTIYAPAEAMIVTRTAKDSAGNVPYDLQTAGEVTFNRPVTGTVGASFYKGGVKVSATSAATSTLFAPVVGGALVGTMLANVDGVTGIKATVNVTDTNAALLTQLDALNAKIVALNALIAKIMKKLGVK
jgi:hypothetical protein